MLFDLEHVVPENLQAIYKQISHFLVILVAFRKHPQNQKTSKTLVIKVS